LRVARDSDLPLSLGQERLWFLEQMYPGGCLYNITGLLNLAGDFSFPAFEQSLREVITRHEALRSRFHATGGRPVQRVAAEVDFDLPLVDLDQMDPVHVEKRIGALAVEEARRPFSLTSGPLIRAILLGVGRQEHYALVSMHHIVSDGWSVAVLIKEMRTLYEAYCDNRPPALPDLPVQYADFAYWQRLSLSAEAVGAQLEYWKKQLEGAPASLDLFTDRPRPVVQTFRGSHYPVRAPESLVDLLRTAGRRYGVTLFMTALSAFEALLFRYTGQGDFCVGTPIAGRNRLETEGLIGFFANILVIRARLDGRVSVAQVFERCRETVFEAHAHQDLPFEKLVEELQPERSLNSTPFFRVAFALQNRLHESLEMAGVRLAYSSVDNGTSKFDLTLSMEETERELRGWIEYNADIFDRESISRFASHFLRLLKAIGADSSQPIHALSLLSNGERLQILVEWNDTGREYPANALIHEMFERQVEHGLDRIAFCAAGDSIAYRELNKRANRLAHHLIAVGLGPGEFVGVCLRRSVHLIISVLGITKAGCAYVPLDPAWPMERLYWVLGSLNIQVLITENSLIRVAHDLAWSLPSLSHVICSDVEALAPEPEPIDADSVRALWDHVAERATNRLDAFGFISSYTGDPFTSAEVNEYLTRVVELARPLLDGTKRVLEIGCGAGLVMFELAREAGHYVGLDPSEATQSRNRDYAEQGGYDNLTLITGFADEVAAMPPESFDLIVISSAIQFFPGPFYTSNIITRSLDLLKPGGSILIADVMDARLKEEFRSSLLEYKNWNPQAKTKTQLGSELYFDEEYFHDLKSRLPRIEDVQVLHRDSGFDNELRYRYDVLIKRGDGRRDSLPSRKRFWTAAHLYEAPDANPVSRTESYAVAYVIFTSGSTGTPKGVAVTHRAAANVIDWVNRVHDVGPADRLLFVTSLCFDLSVYDIFGTLAAGASIRLVSNAELQEPARLLDILRTEEITFWDSAPAAMQQLTSLLPADGPAALSALKLVLLSGDWIPLSLPDRIRAAAPAARVISLGGATEATVWSNSYPVGDVAPHWVSIPYGRPIQNATYHVLDPYLNPSPVGAAGELYIGGDCLALGYTDPQLTAASFIPNPFAVIPAARMYRTGDRARYRPDGNIEFLGRIDQQVKVRGFRIELGEIEQALIGHPAVQETLVIVRDDKPGDRRLVAYFVLAPGASCSANELRPFLKEKLPEYMVPSAFVSIEAIPVTANGKVDRRALPSPESAPSDRRSFVAPANKIEQRLAEIWCELLSVEGVGVHDDFFDLGGHSLLATQAIARIRDALNVDLPLRKLFEATTIYELSKLIEQTRDQQAGPGSSGIPRLRRSEFRLTAVSRVTKSGSLRPSDT
jgi:amino acid adenylation domain-containing protein